MKENDLVNQQRNWLFKSEDNWNNSKLHPSSKFPGDGR